MTIDINAHRWSFLRPEKADSYINLYNIHREEGWKELLPSTMRRQFATAREILNRMNDGKLGVLLADDVGLGKTTVAVLCALVFAGSEKRVRILAPNEMMARRWRQELELHIGAVADFATHLKLKDAVKRVRDSVKRLHSGTIEVSTHFKANQLACDLLIIDEAHRTRSENSNLAKGIECQSGSIGRVLVLTATPFSIDPNDLARLLTRIGAEDAEKPMREYARMLDELWRGRLSGDPEKIAEQLVQAARTAVKHIRPFVIRHGIDDLPARERQAFGEIDDNNNAGGLTVPDDLLEAMLRTDRALALGRKCKKSDIQRRNDPRYHVALGKLDNDLKSLRDAVDPDSDDDSEALAARHVKIARQHIKANGRHPKITDTVKAAREFVEAGEKVLVFCDHHLPAVELAVAIADEIRWPEHKGKGPAKRIWMSAWESVFADIAEKAEMRDGRGRSTTRLKHYIDWLISPGVRMQLESWLGSNLQSTISDTELKRLLEKTRARSHQACDKIAAHARQLFSQLVDPESGSTRAILLRNEATRLPGTTKARIAAVCQPETETSLQKHPGVFYPGQPDATLAVFNSPFGPDVLVTTDRLSEGVDLHRFCRHLIHHELDPSPVRIVQRNGRLRRVNSWAARTKPKQSIRILYPALQGTRDEKLVEIVRYRMLQFDLLLGGVRTEVDPDSACKSSLTTAAEVLDLARTRLGRIRLGILHTKRKPSS